MKQLTRKLRAKQTDAERNLWGYLRNRELCGFKFHRQHAIGCYVADFYCPEARLVIEVDGGQHAEQTLKDQKRTFHLNQLGCKVIRFWDHEVLQETESVLDAIRSALTLTPALSLKGRGGNMPKGRDSAE